jgi:FkbM family methyltransferase
MGDRRSQRKTAVISYAQNFEDVMLARVFDSRTNGFYVDVGAGDPVNLSVTKWFYDLGWSGINIEPNKTLFKRLVEERPRDINLDCGAGRSRHDAEFLETAIAELSSFDPDVISAEVAGTDGTTRTVPVFPLTEILDRHGGGRPIDFLKIDVEGWEHEVLAGLDLERYRPTIIVVEATLPQTRVESHGQWENALLGAKYSFAYFDGLNRFYLAEENIQLKQHFTLPPNVFDDFRTFRLVSSESDLERLAKALDAKEADLARLADTLNRRDADLKELKNAVVLKELQLERLNNTIVLKESQLERLNNTVTLKDSQLERFASIDHRKESEIARLNDLVAAKEADFGRLANLLSGKDAEIERLTSLVAGKDAEIERLTSLVAGKDAEIERIQTATLRLYDELERMLAIVDDGKVDSDEAALRTVSEGTRILRSRKATLHHFFALNAARLRPGRSARRK